MSRAAIRAAELRVLAATDAIVRAWSHHLPCDPLDRALVLAGRALRRLTKPKPGKERSRGK